jgi:hypothetical protein
VEISGPRRKEREEKMTTENEDEVLTWKNGQKSKMDRESRRCL